MPAFERAELTAELRVIPPSDEAREATEAARRTAGESGLARDAGPESIVLAGDRHEVLAALTETVQAALDAGTREIRIKVEAEADAERFDQA